MGDSNHPKYSHWFSLASTESALSRLFLGYPVLVIIHSLICFSWLLIFIIPVAKMNVRMVARILLADPEQVHVKAVKLHFRPKHPWMRIRFCAAVMQLTPTTTRYTMNGMNVFAVNFPSKVKGSAACKPVFVLVPSISARSMFAMGAVVSATSGSTIQLTFLSLH